MSVTELAVIMVLGIPIAALIGATSLIALRILKGGRNAGQQLGAEEAKMIQEVYQGLLKMEERVESLETILLDRERKGNAR